MGVAKSKCKHCGLNDATHYKIVKSALNQCKCSNVVGHKINKKPTDLSSFERYDISMIEYYSENCRCNRRKEYNHFIVKTLRTNIPIVEFKGDIPEYSITNDYIKWTFLACEDCMKERPWAEQYLIKITEDDVLTE